MDAETVDPLVRGKYGSAVVGDRYVVQNNVWGADTAQALLVGTAGFAIMAADHRNRTDGPPAAYASIYYGCHYGMSSPGTILPMRVDSPAFAGVRSTVRMVYPDSGVYDASYDLWFDPTPRTDGQNTGAELMLWLNRTGPVRPAGERVGSADLAGSSWEVWYADVGWSAVSYLRTTATDAIAFAVADFYRDAVARGYAQPDWYLTSVQAGFEPWVGGAGLAVAEFSVTT